MYWIAKYNSFKDGYNMTKGGYSYNPQKRYTNGYKIVDSKYDEIEEMFLSGFSATKIAELYQVDRHIICNLLKQWGYKLSYNRIKLNTIETEELIKQYKSGWSLKGLSKKYGYSAPSIKDFLIKKGVDLRKKYSILENLEEQKEMINDYLEKKINLKDILRKYHCEYKTFEKVLSLYDIPKVGKGKNYKLSEKDCLKAIQMLMDGKKVFEISNYFKVDKCTIYSMFKRYHIDYLNYNNSTSTQTPSKG